MKLLSVVLVLLLTACASQPKPLRAPEWDVIPQGVMDTFCLRLQAEGVAAGAPVTVVNVTQPIASMRVLAALAGPRPKKVTPERAAEALQGAQKTIPLTLAQSACTWIAIDAAAAHKRADQMVVEMSAPVANPFTPGTAGVFVRVSLAGEHPSWYWISLIPTTGGWTIGYIHALPV